MAKKSRGRGAAATAAEVSARAREAAARLAAEPVSADALAAGGGVRELLPDELAEVEAGYSKPLDQMADELFPALLDAAAEAVAARAGAKPTALLTGEKLWPEFVLEDAARELDFVFSGAESPLSELVERVQIEYLVAHLKQQRVRAGDTSGHQA